jgi:tetratricopeptide (TPR) repeat protein
MVFGVGAALLGVVAVVIAGIVWEWLSMRKNPRILVARDEQANALRRQALNGSGLAGPLLADAISLHRYNLRLSRWVLGKDHPGTSGSRASLARDYRAAGDVRRAIELFEQLLAYSERVDGPEHRDTRLTRDELAGSYQAANRHHEAVALFERTVADIERSRAARVRAWRCITLAPSPRRP